MTRADELAAVVWIGDAGVAPLLAVSVASLRANAPQTWASAAKVIFDAGLDPETANWLDGMASDGVLRRKIRLPHPDEIVGGRPYPAAQVMRVRLCLPRLVSDLAGLGHRDIFLHVDTDTVFLRPPDTVLAQAWAGEDIRAVREWDWIDRDGANRQYLLTVARSSTFSTDRSDNQAVLERRLGLEPGELAVVPTYNTGVWLACAASSLAERWEKLYEELCTVDTELGGDFLNPHRAEETAFGLLAYRGDCVVRHLPRRFNYFPPRPPQTWPADTAIAHFITFGRNRRQSRYRPWFATRDAVANSLPAKAVTYGEQSRHNTWNV